MLDVDVKQVIVMRKDLKMRRGKEIAQGAHAATAWLAHRVRAHLATGAPIVLSTAEAAWLERSHTKICVQVDSEAELRRVYADAIARGLEAHLIVDSGRTEFGGVPTATCCAVGPGEATLVDAVTNGLKLY